MDITGTLKVKFDEVKIKDSFKKREFVITDNSSNYPQHIKMELVQDKTSVLDQFNPGDEIKVFFNLRGREYVKDGQAIYFNSLQAWRIEKAGNSNNASSSNTVSQDFSGGETFSGKEDDLPF